MAHVVCGGEDQIGRIEYLARQLHAPDAAARACSLAPAAAAAARACSTALGAAAPQHRRTIQGAATALRLLYNASCRGSRARRPDRLAQAKNKIAERANMEGKR